MPKPGRRRKICVLHCSSFHFIFLFLKMSHTPCHWLTTYTCMCMCAETVFPEWCYLWLVLFFSVCVWERGTEMLLWYLVQQSAFIAVIIDFQRETTESLDFYAVPYMCVVCNALCNHLHSQTRTSHSNSDALPILRTLTSLVLCSVFI